MPDSAWAYRTLAEVATQLGKMVNPTQPKSTSRWDTLYELLLSSYLVSVSSKSAALPPCMTLA